MKTTVTVKRRKGTSVPVDIEIDQCSTLDEWKGVRTERELVAMLNMASESYCRHEATSLLRKGKTKADVEALFQAEVVRAPGPLKKTGVELEIEKLEADPQLRMEFIRGMLESEKLRHETLAAFQKAASPVLGKENS